MDNRKKAHWEAVYRDKNDTQVGWYQEHPEISLRLVEKYSDSKYAPLIDVGGGNSHLARMLYDHGYKHLTVLDISMKALTRNRNRFESNGNDIVWLETDVLQLKHRHPFSIWHDRAVFHFLTDERDIRRYVRVASENIAGDGFMIMGTFSESGPDSCSGLSVTQYSSESLNEIFSPFFNLQESFEDTHITPSGNPQNFLWAVFQRK